MQQYQLEPHTIRERLMILYEGEDINRAYEGIMSLIDSYRTRIQSEPYHLSEKDAILITYADNVHDNEAYEPPLETLNTFMRKHYDGLINTIHLLPFYPYSSDDGFSVVDYKEVDPHFGSWNEIHKLGSQFRLMFDAVINHTSQFSPWFKGYLNNDPAFKDFYIEADPSVDLSQVIRPRALPLLHDFEDIDGRIRHIWTTFSRDQVDINYSNYKVLLAVLDVLFFYIEQGAKLIRLDAVAFIWKIIGSECIHLPQTHEAIQLMREVLHILAPEIIIITETNVPHMENIAYFGFGDDEAQMVYNFALPPLLAHSVLTADPSALTAWASTLKLPGERVCFFNFTASHDGVGVRPVSELLNPEDIDRLVNAAQRSDGKVSFKNNPDGSQSPYELNCSYIDLLSAPEDDDGTRARRMLLTQAAMMAMPGVPGIYFHSLVGSRNWTEGVEMTGMNRTINRAKYDIHHLEKQIGETGSLGEQIYTGYKHMLNVRVNESAFDPFGSFLVLPLHPSLFTILRESPNLSHKVIAMHNFADAAVTLDLPEFMQLPGTELIADTPVQSHTFTIAAYGTAWIRCEVDVDKLSGFTETSVSSNT